MVSLVTRPASDTLSNSQQPTTPHHCVVLAVLPSGAYGLPIMSLPARTDAASLQQASCSITRPAANHTLWKWDGNNEQEGGWGSKGMKGLTCRTPSSFSAALRPASRRATMTVARSRLMRASSAASSSTASTASRCRSISSSCALTCKPQIDHLPW